MARPKAYKYATDKISASHMAFNLAGIAALLALLGVGIAYGIDAMSRTQRVLPTLWTAGPAIRKIIAGQELAIPPSWFRFSNQRVEEFSEKIDLLFALPLGENGRVVEIEISLVPRSQARASERLLDAIYLHQFLPQQLEGPAGLVGKPLKEREGFQGESVWYDPLSASPFVAKCMAPITTDTGGTCVRTVLLGDRIAATYVFDSEVLSAWKRFDKEAALWLEKIGGI